jgi:hypothetical protein
VNASGKLRRQGIIYRTMTREQPLTVKLVGDQYHLEVGFGSGRYLMVTALIQHFQMSQRESRIELCGNSLFGIQVDLSGLQGMTVYRVHHPTVAGCCPVRFDQAGLISPA